MDHSTRGDWTNGGNRVDNGLDEGVGDALIHIFDCSSGDNCQLFDEGGVNGIHIGASGDKDDEVDINDVGRFVESTMNYDQINK